MIVGWILDKRLFCRQIMRVEQLVKAEEAEEEEQEEAEEEERATDDKTYGLKEKAGAGSRKLPKKT